jgi:hypothetical protein
MLFSCVYWERTQNLEYSNNVSCRHIRGTLLQLTSHSLDNSALHCKFTSPITVVVDANKTCKDLMDESTLKSNRVSEI